MALTLTHQQKLIQRKKMPTQNNYIATMTIYSTVKVEKP